MKMKLLSFIVIAVIAKAMSFLLGCLCAYVFLSLVVQSCFRSFKNPMTKNALHIVFVKKIELGKKAGLKII